MAREDDPPPPYVWMDPQQAASRKRGECPRCLPPSASIATPRGDIAVADLRAGDTVWTLDQNGARVEATLLAVESRWAPADHKLARVVLADGRRVAASPGHPIPGGRPIGELGVGDRLDGAVIQRVDAIDLVGGRTYDLLPSGSTGVYWADGVLLASTLDHLP